MGSKGPQALSIIRFAVGLLLAIHGIARVSLGIVDDFGGLPFTATGFPMGAAIAWSITVIEIVGGPLLSIGKFRFILSLYFAAQLVVGIILVHWSSGWFVVGAGNNGMEYSILLIACLVAIALDTRTSGLEAANGIADAVE